MREGDVTNRDVPFEVRDFLAKNIASYEHLELLLFLRKSGPATADAMASAARIPPSFVDEALLHLVKRGLIHKEGMNFSFAPSENGVAAVVDSLALIYDDDRLAIMNVMNANAIERVRNQALYVLADAFIVGRKKE